MHTSRLSLAGAIILMLVGGLSAAAVAQDESPAPVTFVTGTVVEQYDHPGANDIYEGPPEDVRGWLVGAERYGVIEQVIEWSDPRLPPQHWMNMNLAFIFDPREAQGPPEGAMAVTTSNLLEGPEGSWRGTGRAVEGLDDRYSLYELTGEGAYDGLWAVLRMTPGADASGPLDQSYEGYIFEADPMVFPAQPESVTTEGMQTYPEERSTAVVAQDDVEAPSATHVTGTRLSTSMTSEPEEWEDGDVHYWRGVQTERTVEWSDPRLPSRFLVATNANWHALEDGAVGGFANAVRLVSDDGDWAGTEYALAEPESSVGLYVLTGSGAYEGLWAIFEGSLVMDADGNPVVDADGRVTNTYDGYIFESELPPMPDPIKPPAE